MALLSPVQLSGADAAHWLAGAPLKILGILIGAVVLRWVVGRLIKRVIDTANAHHEDRRRSVPHGADQVFAAVTLTDPDRQAQRVATLATILSSISTAVIYGVATLTILAILGIPLAPLLTSAGVGGVALGFGAQSLVKDFLSGIFMIMEDQYGVGDYIDTGEAIGYVEDVSLRVTRLRDRTGQVWYVRNGEVVRIGNTSQGWSLGVVDMPIAYDEDVAGTVTLITSVLHQIVEEKPWADLIIDEPKVAGVESVTAGAVTIRIEARCVPMENGNVQRELRERVKAALDAAGVRGGPTPVLPSAPSAPH